MIPTTSQLLDRDPVEIARHIHDSAVACYAEGKSGLAESLFCRARRLLEEVKGPDSPDLVKVLNSLALVHEDRGEYAAAEQCYQRSLRIMEQTVDTVDTEMEPSPGPNSEEVADVHSRLGMLGQYQGHFEEASCCHQQQLNIVDQTGGPEHAGLTSQHHGLGCLEPARGQYPEGEPLPRRAVEVREQALAREYPHVVICREQRSESKQGQN